MEPGSWSCCRWSCSGGGACSSPELGSGDRTVKASDPPAVAASDIVRPSEEPLRQLAKEVPAFGGAYFNGDGDVVVSLTGTTTAGEAKKIEQWAEPLLKVPARGGAPAQRTLMFTGATYSFSELDAWRNLMLPDLVQLESVVSIGIRKRANKVKIGIDDPAAAGDVTGVAQLHGVPEAALLIEQDAPIQDFSHNLSSEFLPVPGGVKTDSCTLGFAANTQLGGPGYFINSHCTTDEFADDGDPSYQPNWVHQELGVEWSDPSVFFCYVSGYLATCRYSDAAFLSMSAWSDYGRIARTLDWSGSEEIDHNTPRFTLNGTVSLAEGQYADKVGWQTGWTYGQVTETCIDISKDSGVWMLCQNRVDGVGSFTVADNGDSGAPVFRLDAASTAQLAGILWGGNTGANIFVYSPYENVVTDFDDSLGWIEVF